MLIDELAFVGDESSFELFGFEPGPRILDFPEEINNVAELYKIFPGTGQIGTWFELPGIYSAKGMITAPAGIVPLPGSMLFLGPSLLGLGANGWRW